MTFAEATTPAANAQTDPEEGREISVPERTTAPVGNEDVRVAGSDTNNEPPEAAPATATSSSKDMTKRRKLRAMAAVLLIIVAVVFAVLIPTVFLDSNNDNEWKRTLLDVFFESELLDNMSASELPAKNYGEYVAMSASGNRVALTTDMCEGHIQVWDYVAQEEHDKESNWQLRARFAPHEGGSSYSYYPEGLDMSDDGSRIIFSNKGIARVFEDVSGTGTEWVQVGEALTTWSFASLMDLSDYPIMDDRSFGETVAMSSDGTIIVVAAPYSAENKTLSQGPCYGFHPNSPMCLCGVQVYQHRDSLVNTSVARDDSSATWIPRGQLLLDESEDEFYARDVQLTGDGNRLVLAPRSKHTAMLSVYDYDEMSSSWQKVQDIFGASEIPGGQLFGSNAVLSRDGQVLATRYGNVNSPTLGFTLWVDEKIDMYVYNNRSKRYKFLSRLEDVPGGEKAGTTLAISDRYDLAVGSTYGPIEVFEFDNPRANDDLFHGRWEHRFNLDHGRKTVAMSADGTRIVSGTPPWGVVGIHRDEIVCGYEDTQLRGIGEYGSIQVYDRKNK